MNQHIQEFAVSKFSPSSVSQLTPYGAAPQHNVPAGQDPIVSLFEQIVQDAKTSRRLRMTGQNQIDHSYSEHSAAIADMLKDVAQVPHRLVSGPSLPGTPKSSGYPGEGSFTRRIAEGIRQVALFPIR